MQNLKYIIGIDEVGRGPVAGPVAVGAVLFSVENKTAMEERFSNFKDSKKLTPKKRNEWFENIKKAKDEGLLDYRVVFVDNKKIDEFGIAPSIRSCIKNSLKKITSTTSTATGLLLEDYLILLDGGLKAPEEFVNQKTIIKGDEKEMVIALASIMAKVTRDALMCNLAKNYPKYELEKHKGYGTKAHMTAIKKHGISEIHRKTFLKNI
ncbi:MAG: ribonuclease HII [Candidatus Pacebacteria bacterium]|nr:ribonuclease HII [Candidatus Paceibacterota bacterium]